jgi:hypothetical protein
MTGSRWPARSMLDKSAYRSAIRAAIRAHFDGIRSMPGTHLHYNPALAMRQP